MKDKLPDFSKMNNLFLEASENMKAIQEQLKQPTELMKSFAETFQIPNYAKYLTNIGEGIRATSSDVEKFKLIMIEMGYPPHFDLEIIKIREIVYFYNKNGKEKTKELIEKFLTLKFNKEVLEEILDKWGAMEWLNKRLPILLEGIEAHICKKFFSSIPTLLPQIEGLIVENFNHKGRLYQSDLKSYADELLSETGAFSFDDAIKLFFLNIVLSNFTLGQDVESPLSRHAILHGADTDYGTELNSLRGILFLDYIIEKIDELTKEKH